MSQKITIDRAHAEIARRIRLAKQRMFHDHRKGKPLAQVANGFIREVREEITDQLERMGGETDHVAADHAAPQMGDDQVTKLVGTLQQKTNSFYQDMAAAMRGGATPYDAFLNVGSAIMRLANDIPKEEYGGLPWTQFKERTYERATAILTDRTDRYTEGTKEAILYAQEAMHKPGTQTNLTFEEFARLIGRAESGEDLGEAEIDSDKRTRTAPTCPRMPPNCDDSRSAHGFSKLDNVELAYIYESIAENSGGAYHTGLLVLLLQHLVAAHWEGAPLEFLVIKISQEVIKKDRYAMNRATRKITKYARKGMAESINDLGLRKGGASENGD